MKHFLLASQLIFIFILPVFSQSKLGDVACVYVTSANLDSSQAVYEKLGFVKKAANEYPSPWVQLTDGSLLIMIRKDNTPYCGLTYYSQNTDAIAAQLEKDSIIFYQKPKADDVIKRYYIKNPDGFTIVLSNNLGGFTQPNGITLLNMNQADYNKPEKYPNKQCGAFGEFAHPVTNLKSSLAFWEKLGFKAKAQMSAPYPHAILSDGLMIIGLHQTNNFNYPAVTYFGINTEKRIEQLKSNGLTGLSAFTGNNNVVLKTWEGQHFFIFSLY